MTAKQQPKPTEYVVLVERGDDMWVPCATHQARRGEEAIKAITRRSDGTHEAGSYKAVPYATWVSDGNNLTILAEERVVNTFLRSRPPTNGATNGRHDRTPAETR